jgi:hypothetical protein
MRACALRPENQILFGVGIRLNILVTPRVYESELSGSRCCLLCLPGVECSIEVHVGLVTSWKKGRSGCNKTNQHSETNVMHFLFNLLRIKGLYMFRALLAHHQEELHRRHLVYCDKISSINPTSDKSLWRIG